MIRIFSALLAIVGGMNSSSHKVVQITGLLTATVSSCVIAYVLFVVVWPEPYTTQPSTQQVALTDDPGATTPTPQPRSSPTPLVSQPAITSSGESSTAYNNGSYTASQSYVIGRGTSTVSATVTVENDVITVVRFANIVGDPESREYIGAFEGAIQPKVVGKRLADVSVSRVGGASLTTNAFTQVITKIENQAIR